MFTATREAQQNLHRRLAHLILRLVNRSQRRVYDTRKFHVVEAHHRDIFRNPASRLHKRADYAERHHVAGRKHRRHIRM